MHAHIAVRSKTGEYRFVCKLHQSVNPATHQIEPEFYTKFSPSHTVPTGNHFECEIIFPEFWTHPEHGNMHLYKSAKTGNWFVCWTQPIPDLSVARHALEIWCTGTVYTMENSVRFDKLLSTDELTGSDFHKALAKLREEFGIQMVGFQIQ